MSLPGRLVLSDLIGAGNRQMVNVRQDHIIPNFPRLANMAWTFDMDLTKHHLAGTALVGLHHAGRSRASHMAPVANP